MLTKRGIAALMTPDEVAERLGISRRALNYMIAGQRFPRPISLGHRTKRWKPEVVEAFLEQQSYTPR